MLETLAAIDAAIGIIEGHLGESLDLDRIAGSVHYSKYHLNRLFSAEVGTSIHDYIVRRRLTVAAEAIADGAPILDAALACGYESQQSFSAAFKALYKATSGEFRRERFFYPLQARASVDAAGGAPKMRPLDVRRAGEADLVPWLEVVAKSVDCLPRLDFEGYAERLPEAIGGGGGIIAFDGRVPVGVAVVSPGSRSVDCLAVAPRYRARGGYEALVDRALEIAGGEVSLTTFRAGDRADTGQRRALEAMGFDAREPLVDQGYPVQRYVLSPSRREETRCRSDTSPVGKGRPRCF